MGKYTLVNRFTLGDPALRPYPSASDAARTARHGFEDESVVVTGPAAWSMVPVHPDQLKERRVFWGMGSFVGRWGVLLGDLKIFFEVFSFREL